jgi:predicted anti-sigma-YlaC factor YlaD
VLSGCASIATRAVANALTGVGNSTVFTGDTDPELIGGALPLAIKMYEALLETQPNHDGLILTTGSLFVMYATAFVQQPAEMLPPQELDRKKAGQERAKQLYLRGVAILSRGLERRYPGITGSGITGSGYTGQGGEDRAAILARYTARMKKSDVPLIYWYVAGSVSAYAIDPFDLGLGTRLPALIALINRAYELDGNFNNGALDEFFVLFHASVPAALGGDPSKIGLHYEKALEKSQGRSAAAYLAYAQAVCIPAQDYAGFRQNLEAALAIDVNADPSSRLVNVINQRKARYLLSRASWYFLEAEDEDDALW